MHRIDSNGAVDGKFQAGNPSIGQQATQLDVDWHNAVQEAICNVIESAGITLEKGDNEQLYDAIVAITAGIVGTGGGATPTTRNITATGLATGGGDLAADRTIDVAIASAAEILAGLLNNKAVTPLGLATLFGAGLGDNGYEKMPGGRIMQWGVLRAGHEEGTVTVNFPVSFVEKCYAVIPVPLNSSANNHYDIWCQNVSRTLTTATFFYNFDGSTEYINGLDYIAIGK